VSGPGQSSREGQTEHDRGLLDTSVFIAEETGRPLGLLPIIGAVSVVTVAELHVGVLMSEDPTTRAQRLRTLASVESRFDPLPVDRDVARVFSEIVAEARRASRRPKVMDTWIAATAVAHGLLVYTQDDDFENIPQVRVVRV
jgi:predicted nucleic acid-binding protein